MNVISKKAIRRFAEKHPDALGPLMRWFRTAKKASWRSLVDVRQQFPQADAVPPYTVFNIGGNKYRLIAEIGYQTQVVLIRAVLTHPEYDKGVWKK